MRRDALAEVDRCDPRPTSSSPWRPSLAGGELIAEAGDTDRQTKNEKEESMNDLMRTSPAGSHLTLYEEARQALDRATRIDEVKTINDSSIAMAAYARQARDPELIAKATDLRKRAERRIGEMIDKQRAAGLLATGGDATRARVRGRPELKPPTLDEVGIDKHLADRSRKLARMTPEAYEAHKEETIAIAVASISGRDKEIVKAAKARRHAEAKARREQREAAFAGKVLALPAKKYGVILTDNEWRFVTYSEAGKDSTSADNHYPTSSLDELKARPVASIAAKDCVLFMWATGPMLKNAFEVMEAWGFTYKARVVWGKQKRGTAYWFWDMAEELLVGVRGKVPAPAQGDQWDSLQISPKGRHSEKPEWAYELIEAYFPNVPKIELNARRARPGWDSWGFEAPAGELAEAAE